MQSPNMIRQSEPRIPQRKAIKEPRSFQSMWSCLIADPGIRKNFPSSQPPKKQVVGPEGTPERFVDRVPHAVTPTDLLYERREPWIVNVENPGKQVVLNLVVQTAYEPHEPAALASEVS